MLYFLLVLLSANRDEFQFVKITFSVELFDLNLLQKFTLDIKLGEKTFLMTESHFVDVIHL